jgi:hypothetical protein
MRRNSAIVARYQIICSVPRSWMSRWSSFNSRKGSQLWSATTGTVWKERPSNILYTIDITAQGEIVLHNIFNTKCLCACAASHEKGKWRCKTWRSKGEYKEGLGSLQMLYRLAVYLHSPYHDWLVNLRLYLSVTAKEAGRWLCYICTYIKPLYL